MTTLTHVPGQARGLLREVERARGGGPAAGHSVSKAIAVTSGKGGVGKTNIVVNLALALAGLGRRVLIFDADLGLANVDVILGLKPRDNLYHVITGQRALSEILTEGPGGIQVIAGGSGVVELANIGEAERALFFDQLKPLEDSFDVMLIDTAAGLSHNVLAFLLASQEIILVTVPEPAAMADAYGILKAVFSRNPGARIKLVVNRARGEEEAKDVYRRMSFVTKKFLSKDIGELGFIYEDPVVVRAVKAQEPFIISAPNARASRAVQAIARRLLVEEQPVFDELAERSRFSSIRTFFTRLTGRFK